MGRRSAKKKKQIYENPGNSNFSETQGDEFYKHGWQLFAEENFTDAEDTFKRALEIYTKVLPDKDHQKLGNAHHCLSISYFRQNKYHKVKFHSKKALKIRTQLGHEEGVADVLSYMGNACTLEGNLIEGERHLKKSYELYTSLLEEHHEKVVDTINSLCRNLERNKRFNEAEEWYKKYINIMKSLHGNNDIRVAVAWNKIANIHKERGSIDNAIESFQKCIEIYDHLRVCDSLDKLTAELFAETLYEVGTLQSMQNKIDETIKIFKKCLKIKYEIHGENSFHIINTLNNLGMLISQKGNYSEARIYLEKALKHRGKFPSDEKPTIEDLQENYATITIMEQLNIKPNLKLKPAF